MVGVLRPLRGVDVDEVHQHRHIAAHETFRVLRHRRREDDHRVDAALLPDRPRPGLSAASR
jgi:hypothetical protein